MMRMRRIEKIEVPAGETVTLKPGGLHVMLIGLKQTLEPGDAVDLTLVFEDEAKKRFSQEITAPVNALGAGNAPMAPMHDMGAMEHKH